MPLKRSLVTPSGHSLVGQYSSVPLLDSSQFHQQPPLRQYFPTCCRRPPLS